MVSCATAQDFYTIIVSSIIYNLHKRHFALKNQFLYHLHFYINICYHFHSMSVTLIFTFILIQMTVTVSQMNFIHLIISFAKKVPSFPYFEKKCSSRNLFLSRQKFNSSLSAPSIVGEMITLRDESSSYCLSQLPNEINQVSKCKSSLS